MVQRYRSFKLSTRCQISPIMFMFHNKPRGRYVMRINHQLIFVYKRNGINQSQSPSIDRVLRLRWNTHWHQNSSLTHYFYVLAQGIMGKCGLFVTPPLEEYLTKLTGSSTQAGAGYTELQPIGSSVADCQAWTWPMATQGTKMQRCPTQIGTSLLYGKIQSLITYCPI